MYGGPRGNRTPVSAMRMRCITTVRSARNFMRQRILQQIHKFVDESATKQTRKKILILTTSLCVSLVCIEFALRALHIRPKIFTLRSDYVKLSNNPILGYELNPNDPEINSYGLRKPEISITKQPDITRIIALGDSITFGCCTIPSNQTYPFFLEKKLNTMSSNKVEVVNAGVVGYNTMQEAEFYKEKIKDLKPDFLILQVTLNDWQQESFEYNSLLTQLPKKSASISYLFFESVKKSSRFLWNSYLFQYLTYIKSAISTNNIAAFPTSKEVVLGIQSQDLKIAPWENTNIISDGFRQLSSQIEPHLKKNSLVVIFPDFNNLFNYAQEYKDEHAYIIKTAQENGFQVLDLRNCYQNDFSSHNVPFVSSVSDTVHPNKYGHQVAGNCIAEYFSQHNDL